MTCGLEFSHGDYVAAIVDENVLGKPTGSTRKLTAQRLSELYALDRKIALSRFLLRLYEFDLEGFPLTALLCALARDPLLRTTAPSVLSLRSGEPLDRQGMVAALQRAVNGRLNDATLEKTARNAASSWAQSGHLEGRTFKKRRLVKPSAGPVAMALFLGFLQGMRGPSILRSFWCQVLDERPETLARIASSASMSGLIRFRIAGEAIEVGFPGQLSASEMEALNESN